METSLLSLPLPTLQTWLTEAMTARHELATGSRVSYIAHHTTARTYKSSSITELDGYIASLQGAIQAKLNGATVAARRPIHPGVGY